MHYNKLTTLVLSPLLLLTTATPLDTRDFKEKSYPSRLITTPKQYGFFLRVDSIKQDVVNNRNIQIRPVPGEVINYAVVDNTSPVAAAILSHGYMNLRNVTFGGYQTPNGLYGSLYSPTYYKNHTISLQALIFGDGDAVLPYSWYLSNVSNDGAYWLYYDEGAGVANGFAICEKAKGSETYHQVYYYEYSSGSGALPKGCSNIALEATIAPVDFYN